MAVSGTVYGLHIRDQWGAVAADRVDFVTDDVRMTLHTSGYVANQDTDQYFNTATNELATGGGYTAGGVALAGKTLTYDGPTNTVRFKANDVTWSLATFTARQAVLRKNTGTATTSHLMANINFGADQAPVGVDFVVKADPTDGFMRGVVS